MQKINLLMISSTSKLGGGPTHMFTLGNELPSEFNVFYAIPKGDSFKKFLREDNFINISERKLTLADLKDLLNFINIKSINLIHAHGKGASLLARILRIFSRKKVIYTFHGIHLKCHDPFTRFIYLFYEYIFGIFDNFKVFVSKSEREYALKLNIKIGNSKIICNGVRNKLEKAKKFRKKNDLKPTTFQVISICRFVNQKNIIELVNIAKNSPEFLFTIIGDGPEFKSVYEYVINNKINNVILKGQINRVFPYLYKSDLYLSTSLYEGLPISILEAMSIGLPIIASNVVGNSDAIVHGKSGYLYNLGDIKEAKKYLDYLKINKEKRFQMGKGAFLRQRKYFALDKMVNEYSNLYKKIFFN